MFELDAKLEADTLPVTDLRLCAVRLMNDANYPWAILVPRQPDLAELIDLEPADRAALAVEVDAVSHALKSVTECSKLNVAALGNVVRQLHVHVIARFETDPAWPAPVWGRLPARPYAAGEGETLAAGLAAAIRGN